MASKGKGKGIGKRKDTKSYQKLLDEIKTNPLFKLQAKAGKLGLTNVWAYHCNRCNYVWLPKDFDMAHDRVEMEKRKMEFVADFGEDLFYRKPPKSCARCKSKYWNKSPSRKTKNTFKDSKYFLHKYMQEPTIRQPMQVPTIRRPMQVPTIRRPMQVPT